MPKPNFDHHFGIVLRQARNREGLTQQSLAERTGTSRGFISDVERGEKGVSLEKFVELTRAFGGITPEDLLSSVLKRLNQHENSN